MPSRARATFTGQLPDTVALLTLVERSLTARLAAALEVSDGNVEQWRVLELLGQNNGLPMSVIAEQALLPAPTLTKVVDRMISANLVYRRSDIDDRRRILVYISERGEHVLRTWADAAEGIRDELELRLGPDGKEQLRELLLRLAAWDASED